MHDTNIFKKTKSDLAVENLRQAILSGEIEPGEWLRQDQIAERFKISPTPVREAFRRLEADGLIERIPHQGVKVVAYTPNIAREYYDLRALLEPYALRLAVTRMTPEVMENFRSSLSSAQYHLQKNNLIKLTEENWDFHDAIIRLCGSPLVRDVLIRVRRSFQLDTLLMLPERAADSLNEHKAIYKALTRGDVKAAEREMKIHIENARAVMLTRLPTLGNSK